jgi:hypothetical protein
MGPTRFMVALAALSIMACSPAPGDPILPAGNPDRVFDADCPTPGPTGSGETFTSLYNDLFGPKGVARCADGACHGGASEQGGLRLKNTKDEAYEGMKDYGLIQPEPDAGFVNVTPLVNIVSKPLASTGKPKMPRELCGNRLLNAAEVKRIEAWGMKSGKND